MWSGISGRIQWLGVFVCLLVSLAVSAGPAAATSAPPKPASVLWIGNSFTYYNGGLPAMVKALVAEIKPSGLASLRTGMETIGGAHLPVHAAAPDLGLADGWDLVIVQGYSDEPIHPEKAETFRTALASLDARIAAAGSQTALFMTWAYKNQPAMTRKLANAYLAAGQKINAQVIPVGMAFAAVQTERPNLALYVAEDNKHPSPAGTYLAACTFYAALYGQPPKGANFSPKAMSVETKQYLQAKAWQTVTTHYGWPATGP